MMLEQVNYEKRELLKAVLESNNHKPSEIITEPNKQEINPKFVPWRVRQQMLEAEDRKVAQLLKDKDREIKELETEVIGEKENANSISGSRQ